MQSKHITAVPDDRIISQIYMIRGKKVMLDRDLAELYGVTTGNLNKAVSRNIERFPDGFMFQLSKAEFDLIFQNGTSKWGGTRKPPRAFTEQGVAMLSSVLRSKRAIQVNIQIMLTFSKLREMLTSHEDLRRKIEAMEGKYDKQFRVVFEALKRLLDEPVKKKEPIGFRMKK